MTIWKTVLLEFCPPFLILAVLGYIRIISYKTGVLSA